MRPNRSAALAAICLVLAGGTAAQAQAPQFMGQWKSANPASTAPDAVLTVEGAAVSWRLTPGAKPMCSGGFTLQDEKPGTVYVDARGRKFVAGVTGSFPTFLLEVNPGTCGGGADAWRLSFPLPYDRRHMELTEYRNGRPVAFRRLQRVD